MFIEDLILAAGGFLEIADREFVYVNRLNRDLEKGSYSKLKINELDIDYMLGLKKTPSNPFILENFDIVTVISPIRANFQPVVSVRGEVNFPGSIIIENDQTTLNEVITRVGGYTNNHNTQSSYIERDGFKLFTKISKNNSYEKVKLQNGDVVVIGSRLTSIKTTGAVLMPTAFNWEEGKRAKYYIKNSGGKDKRIESVVVLHANGNSERVGLFKNPKIYPGSVINIIAKPKKEKGANDGKFIEDFTRIFGILATTLTTILLTSKL